MMRMDNQYYKLQEAPIRVNLPGVPTDRVRPHQTACVGVFIQNYIPLIPQSFFNKGIHL